MLSNRIASPVRAVCLVFALLGLESGAAQAQVVTEFSAGITTDAFPNGITAGPDGNLWFAEQGIDRIGRITPLGVVTEFSAGITANSAPYGITAGPDGNLWFTEFFGHRIGRITPLGVVTEFSAGITAGAQPSGITAGPDGNLWFTEYGGHRIGRITPAGVVTEFSAGITPGAGPYGITAGPDGNLWFTERLGNRIGRITPIGVFTEFSAGITAGSSPRGITAGPDGNLWFTEIFGDRIGRITTGVSGPAPTVTSIAPDSGDAASGTAIVITGTGFVAGATVTIGGVAATGVNVTSPTTADATTPALTPGTLNAVSLANPDNASGTLAVAWFADFTDVPQLDNFHDFVEKLIRNGVTAGCGGGNFCRNASITRAQMAVFLLKASLGSGYLPPDCTGLVFSDVPCTGGNFDRWIEDLSGRAITGGCGGGAYCPGNSVTRAQMAVFLLKAELGSTYDPPDCTELVFDDVLCVGDAFDPWIEDLANRNITGGCGDGNYCPGSAVTRGQMAVFLVKTFELP